MTVAVEQKPKPQRQQEQMEGINPSKYGCEIILEKTTLETAKDKSFPTDARIVKYIEDGIEYMDLTRGKKMVNIFDMYYDRYGKGAVKSIDFGYGSVNPKMWGYKAPEKKKAEVNSLKGEKNSENFWSVGFFKNEQRI